MISVKENTRPFYLLIINKNKALPYNYFVAVIIRKDEFSNPAYFHGIGYFSNDRPKIENTGPDKQIIEVWIPWDKINYIESLIYKPRD